MSYIKDQLAESQSISLGDYFDLQEKHDALATQLVDIRQQLYLCNIDYWKTVGKLKEAERLRDKFAEALESLIADDGDFHYSSTGTDWVLSVLERPWNSAPGEYTWRT